VSRKGQSQRLFCVGRGRQWIPTLLDFSTAQKNIAKRDGNWRFQIPPQSPASRPSALGTGQQRHHRIPDAEAISGPLRIKPLANIAQKKKHPDMELRLRSVVMRRRRRVWVKIGNMIRVRRRVSIGVWNKIKIGVKANRTHISGNRIGVGIREGVMARSPKPHPPSAGFGPEPQKGSGKTLTREG